MDLAAFSVSGVKLIPNFLMLGAIQGIVDHGQYRKQ
tara:strand:+ start:443 stop:550 length:108 start_codon:yes stop_codon:yes gene_type:complete